MATMHPSVTVIIPAYNREDLIGETLESVRTQTFDGWECIVVDDGSTDGTRAVVEGFAQSDNRFRYVYQKNGERCRARNFGLSLSGAEFVAFLDHDDLWRPEFLEGTVDYLRAHPEAGLVFSYGHTWNGSEYPKEICLPDPDDPDVLKQIIQHGSLFTPVNALLRRELVASVGGFDPAWTLAEDFELWVRFGRRFALHVLKRPLAIYRIHGGNAASLSADWLYVQRRLMNALIYDTSLPARYRQAARVYRKEVHDGLACAALKGFTSPTPPGMPPPTIAQMARGLVRAASYSPHAVWRERWALRVLAKRVLRPGRRQAA